MGFIQYLLTLPASSVDAERGFSRMKLVKNDWRSRLGDKNLTDLMLVNHETEEVGEFDPMPALSLWNSGGVRSKRPCYKDELRYCKPKDIVLLVNNSEDLQAYTLPELSEQPLAEEEAQDENLIEVVAACASGAERDDDDRDDYETDEDSMCLKDILALQLKSYKMLTELL